MTKTQSTLSTDDHRSRCIRGRSAGGSRREPWTEDDIARMRALAADGMTIAEIAAALGRPYGTTRDQLRRSGIQTMSGSSRAAIGRRRHTVRSTRRAHAKPDEQEPDGQRYYKLPSQLKIELLRKRTLTPTEQYQLLLCKQATDPGYAENQYNTP